MSTLIRIEAENFKRLRAVRWSPSGSVAIGGRNEQGKSSLLDAIQALFGGLRNCPEDPIRHGAERAWVLGEFCGKLNSDCPPGKPCDHMVTATRTFEDGKSKLKVVGRDGGVMPRQSEMLAALVGPLSFDPCAWLAKKGAEQAEMLRAMVPGLDFTEEDRTRKTLFDTRTDVSRDAKRLRAQVDGMAVYPTAPLAEVSITDLAAELEAAQAVNAANSSKVSKLDALADKVTEKTESRDKIHAEAEGSQAQASKLAADMAALVAEGKKKAAAVAKLVNIDTLAISESIEQLTNKLREAEATNRQHDSQRTELTALRTRASDQAASVAAVGDQAASMAVRLREADKDLAATERQYTEAGRAVESLADADTNGIKERMASADAVNSQVRANAQRAALVADRDAHEARAADYTAEIKDIDAAKAKAIADADYPVEGLTVDDDGIKLDGVVFSQASQARRLAVAVAVGMADNPSLRVLLVRDGGHLDDQHLAALLSTADDAGVQLLVEVPGNRAQSGIIIEDGEIATEEQREQLLLDERALDAAIREAAKQARQA